VDKPAEVYELVTQRSTHQWQSELATTAGG
jgi:hypothetical protein